MCDPHLQSAGGASPFRVERMLTACGAGRNIQVWARSRNATGTSSVRPACAVGARSWQDLGLASTM